MRFPVFLGPRRSRLLLGYLITLLPICVLAGLTLPFAAEWCVVWCLAVAVAWLHGAWLVLQPLPNLRLCADGNIDLVVGKSAEASESSIPCRLLAGTTIHPWLILLRLRECSGRKHFLLIAKDSLLEEEMRQLRVFLSWYMARKEGGAVESQMH